MRETTTSEIVLWRVSEEFASPVMVVDPKDSNQFENRLKQTRRKRVLVLLFGVVVVVGAAIAIVLSSSSPVEANQKASFTPWPSTTATNETSVLVPIGTDAPTPVPTSVSTPEPTTSTPAPANTTLSPSPTESATVTAEPTPVATPAPTQAAAPTPAPTEVPATSSNQASLRFVNRCEKDIEIVYSLCFEHVACVEASQWLSRSVTWDVYGHQYQSSTFRVGWSPEATLFESSRGGGKVWYDISAIPPGCGNGMSWEACSKGGSVKGYNVAIGVAPQRLAPEAGYNCPPLLCATERCADAYLFPKDDYHTKSCHQDEALVVSFCASS